MSMTAPASIISIATIWEAIKHFFEPYIIDNPPGKELPATESVAEFSYLAHYAAVALIIGIIVVAVLWGISLLLLKIKTRSLLLKSLFIGAWLLSFVVYDVGMYTGQYISLLTNAPMAVIHAFESFLLGSDVSAIHEPFHNSWPFMLLFSLSHAISACVSTLVLIKIFGFNIKQKFRLYWVRKKSVKPETYILWGVNDTTYKMAASIKQHYDDADPQNKIDPPYRIIVVKTSTDQGEVETSALGFNKIFDIISFRDSELQQLQELGCYIANSSNIGINSLSGLSAGPGNMLHDIIRGELKLRSLAKVLECKTADKIHILMLSDDEKQNLHDVSILLNDTTLNNFSENGNGEVVFYCHARYNGVHRVIEDQHRSNKMEVRVIDSSHINVELLKRNSLALPVNYVDVAPDATVTSSFNAMVVGFSEVGQDATRFLYEFGAFVQSGSDNGHARRSEFHLDVIDNRMADKAGTFIANAPAINPSISYEPELKNPDALIELHNMDCRSVAFYKLLEEKIASLNYIVVATDDDELNMTMGVRIFRAATRYRTDMKKLCILIRVHNDDDGHFSKIADYYNRLWAAQESVFKAHERETDIEKKKKLLADILGGKVKNTEIEQNDTGCTRPLHIFGQDKTVYTYDNIIDNTILNEAVEFKEEYKKSTEDNYIDPQSQNAKAWYEDLSKKMQTNDDYHPVYASVMCLRRTQGQDLANSLHKPTKKILRDKALAACGITSVDWTSINRDQYRTSYHIGSENKDKIADILRVLAQTEHLRWNASHEILGYVFDPGGKDEIRLKHDCLKNWEELGEETQSYDNNVVDLSFGIKINISKKK